MKGLAHAGAVTFDANSRLVVDGASLLVDGGQASGGDLNITGTDLIFDGGSLLASSGKSFTGGNVTIKSADQVLLLGTQVISSGGGDGGSIRIDPMLVTLDRARLNANGGVNGGNISIRPSCYLKPKHCLRHRTHWHYWSRRRYSS